MYIKDETVSLKTQKVLVEISMWFVILFSFGSVLYLPYEAYTVFNTSSSAILTSLASIFIPCILIPTIGARLSDYHDYIVGEIEKKLPLHEYDEEVKFWELFDTLKIKREKHSRSLKRKLIGFTDQGTVIVGKNPERNLGKEEIESDNFTHEDFDDVEELRLQDLFEYENVTHDEREFNHENKRKVLKAKNSQYNETLSQLREIERQKLQALEEIYEGRSEIEKIDEELEEEIRSNKSDTRKQIKS